MSKLERKQQVVKDLKEKFAKTAFALVTDYTGLSVSEVTDLRRRLSKIEAEFKVAKNTLVKRAIKDTNLRELEKLLEGPCGLLLSYSEPIESAKAFVGFIREVEKGEIKGGLLDGKFLTKEEIKTLAALPTKEVLYGQIAGLLIANIQGIAGILNRVICDVAVLCEEVAKKNSAVKENV